LVVLLGEAAVLNLDKASATDQTRNGIVSVSVTLF